MFRETAIRPLFGLKKERNMLLYLSALGSRCLPQGGQRKVRTRNDGDRISIIRTVAGNARRGNPRDANRDADAERLGTRKGELRGNAKVQRQKSYLRARPCPALSQESAGRAA